MIAIKREKHFVAIFAFILILLTGIILNISFFKNDQYTHMAANQRTQNNVSRGYITDRNMIPLTGKEERYRSISLARHVIGYTDSDGNGVSGIEKSFNSEIVKAASDQHTSLKDAEGNDIPNFRSTEDTFKENYVKLTLDYHIQKITENVLDSFGTTSAAVVLDVESFDVLAMASRPNFEQNNIGSYISYGDTELLNRATSEYNAGSIFKIITSAAAIEEGYISDDTTFHCDGGEYIDEIFFPCHKPDGHGSLNLDEAFSKSCNCAFYEIGIGLGSETICRYSNIFGLGKQLLGGYITENQGNIPKYLSYSESESANLSIGQGEIMITPLQAAKVACIIAADGMSKDINLVEGIAVANGNMIKSIRKKGTERVISKITAEKIASMMLNVTEVGTGKNAKSQLVTIAGKTGSAETGWQTEDGYMVQGWFIGYFPYENPKYAMAVMTENGRQGNISCAPIFKEIAERIMELR